MLERRGDESLKISDFAILQKTVENIENIKDFFNLPKHQNCRIPSIPHIYENNH